MNSLLSLKRIYKTVLPNKLRNSLRKKATMFYSYVLAGDQVTCNCCGRSYKHFLSKGNGIVKRENAQCPWCFSLERTRLLLFYLSDKTSILDDNETRILHFAPEPTLFNQFKAHVNYIDADIDADNARHVIDIQQIGYGDNYFDFVICSHVLGHVIDENKAIAELYRVLKKGGQAFVLTLLSGKDKTIEQNQNLTEQQRLETYGERDLQRLHGYDLKQRLQAVGFEVELVDYRTTFDADELNRYQLGDGSREMIFVCKKPMHV